ncbi:MAG: hypothetical protein ACYTDW_01050 [Planctomycetota bacterium]|jgi:hypothetical protein
MKTRKVETKVAVLVLAVVGLLAFSLFAAAGGLENNGPPSPVGRPFDRIHDAIASHHAERDGYCRTFSLPADSNQVIFTVPDGKRFVLLNLYSTNMWNSYGWNLTVDDSLFLVGSIGDFPSNFGDSSAGMIWTYDLPMNASRDFPSRCAVINTGETLTVTGSGGTLTIIGYFHDVQ